MTKPQKIDLDLIYKERFLLRQGLMQWGGPAKPTDEVARIIGFRDAAELLSTGYDLVSAIDRSEPLTIEDWNRVLLATEIVFVSLDLEQFPTRWNREGFPRPANSDSCCGLAEEASPHGRRFLH